MSCAILLLLGTLAGPEDHEALNPLYRELRADGVAVSARDQAAVPAPTMPDGLDARAQTAVLKQLGGEEHSLEELVRNSLVAPHILKFRDVRPSDPEAPAYGTDLWFVAHGDLKALETRDATSFLSANRKEITAHVLTDEELSERHLLPAGEATPRERYVHSASKLWDRVEVESTSRSLTSKTAESLVMASRIDPRFAGDPKYPNLWRALDDADPPRKGPARPLDCNASYMKVTRLHEPKGALFVEYHAIATEPKEWFHGANQLRSKLPLVIQPQVRAFRRELAKGRGR